ncbi:MAG: gliding motility-associated C-terminal domain-containing protein [Flavobacteriales bacterium]
MILSDFIRLARVWMVLGFCAWVVQAHGTHLMGGEMSVIYIGNNAAGMPVYEVHCFVYRDCSSANTNGTDFDLIATVGVFEGSNLVNEILMDLDDNLVENVNPENPNNCAFLPEDLCLERAEYIGTVALSPSPVGYDFVYQRCCRSPSITNLVIPQDQGFTIRTNIPPSTLAQAGNSTPTFDALPQAFVCNQYPFSISHSASDTDGDSLAYSLCQIYLGGDVINPIPTPPNPPPFNPVTWTGGFSADNPFGLAANVTIDPVTGVMSGLPIQVGKFSVGICVEEWRNGVMIGAIQRDFTIDVVTCEVLSPVYEPIASCEGMTVNFELFNAPADDYDWDFGVLNSDSDTSSVAEPSFTYDEPGVYDIAMFFSTGGCSDSLFFTVTVAEPWEASFDLGIPACTGSNTWFVPFSVDTTDWPPGTDWTLDFNGQSWSGDFPSEIEVEPGGTLISLVSNWFDCQVTADQSLDLPPMPTADFEMTTTPCGELEATFSASDSNAGPFIWNFGGSANSQTGATVTQTFPSFGTYDVSLTAGVGTPCEVINSVPFTLHPPDPLGGELQIHPISLCDSTGWMQVNLVGMSADDVIWTFDPSAQVVTSSAVEAVLLFPDVGVFAAEVTLTNSDCDVSETILFEIEVPQPLEKMDYFIPNVFSPNNDGKNEVFLVQHKLPDGQLASLPVSTTFTVFDFQVYNRWGAEMHQTGNPALGWRGRNASEGTYFWTLEAQHLCDAVRVDLQGEVSLLR